MALVIVGAMVLLRLWTSSLTEVSDVAILVMLESSVAIWVDVVDLSALSSFRSSSTSAVDAYIGVCCAGAVGGGGVAFEIVDALAIDTWAFMACRGDGLLYEVTEYEIRVFASCCAVVVLILSSGGSLDCLDVTDAVGGVLDMVVAVPR